MNLGVSSYTWVWAIGIKGYMADNPLGVMGLLEKANAANYELITLFYGADLPKPEVNRIADLIRSAYPELEIEVQEGGQPHYHFIISIE